MHQVLYNVHFVIGYAIALYALLLYWLDNKIGKLEVGTDDYKTFNQKMIIIHRITGFLALVAFLIGGYLGTPFFKVGAGWIIVKFVLFLGLMAIMGAFGTKALKMRKEAEASNISLAQANKKMNLYKHLQLIIVALIFYLVYAKPF